MPQKNIASLVKDVHDMPQKNVASLAKDVYDTPQKNVTSLAKDVHDMPYESVVSLEMGCNDKYKRHRKVIPSSCNKGAREFLRFLWFENITDNRPSNIQYRFTRLTFGLTPSPAILNGVIQTHPTHYLLTEPTLSKQLAEGFYVDDFTGGAETVQEGLNIYEKAKELMRKGGFNLHKWHTNSADLQQRIDYLESATLSETSNAQVKILGMMSWDTKEDYFCFEFGDVVSYM